MFELAVPIVAAWATVGFFVWAFDQVAIHEAIWWPIALVKVLIKSLYQVLFTGWRL